MDSRLTPLASLIKETARRFAAERLRTEVARRLPSESWSASRSMYCDLGLHLVDLSREWGGAGLGALIGCTSYEALAAGDVNQAFALPQPGPFAGLVARVGDEQARRRWLLDFARCPLTARGAVAIGPPGTLTAELQGERWHLRGTLPAVWHLAEADRLAVVTEIVDEQGAQTQTQAVFVLETAQHQKLVGEPQRLDGLPMAQTAPVHLDGVAVPQEQCIAKGALGPALSGLFAAEGIRMASYALGTARAASSYVLAFAEERRQSGQPLAHFQSMGFLLIDIELACREALGRLQTAAEASEAALARQMALDWTLEPLDDDLQEAIDVARSKADEVAFFVTDSALQILDDGHGDPKEHPIADWHRDVKMISQSYSLCALLEKRAPFVPGESNDQAVLLC